MAGLFEGGNEPPGSLKASKIGVEDEMVANFQAAYERSPRKSLTRASRELQVPKSTLQLIVHKRLKLYAYKVQLMQRLGRMTDLNEWNSPIRC
ncbi:hypothetical protein ANN_23332 [Periplaneta americana]|uniref:HTH psq-type domain-containing protein n=1 Tax=Periplaneta americana TaxID=6978 RepID=A0ABQ8SM33_PERAM|nr:hypothetical protein ANN_23332 [Periplaneta americana]